jgi:plasmid stability protein
MGQVLIRNLDDALIADYKQAAVDRGRSLEAELRDALAAMRPRKRLSSAEFVALSERLRAGTANKAGSIEGWKLIREDRDR